MQKQAGVLQATGIKINRIINLRFDWILFLYMCQEIILPLENDDYVAV